MPKLKVFYEHLEELIKHSSDIFWIKNADYSKQLYVSPAYEKIWGLPCKHLYEYPGSWINSIFLEDRDRLAKELAKRNPMVLPGQKFYLAYRIVRPDGKICWIEDESFAIFDAKGKHIGFAGIAKDVTEKKLRELSLEKATAEANAANRAKTEFIANMSHDIRTPLNGVIGVADLLKNTSPLEQDKEYGEMIYVAAQRLLELLNGVLDIVSADHMNENDIYAETFNLHDLLRNLCGLMQASVHAKKIELNMEMDSNLPHYVVSDRLKIQRILQNLLGNAIKFTHQGRVCLQVKLLSTRKNEAEVQFCVVDTGIGIPENQVNQVFERFFRATPSYEGVYQGHGVGLYIVKKFIHLLGGEIQLQSEEGKGTRICFALNLKLGKAKDAKAAKNEGVQKISAPVVAKMTTDRGVQAQSPILSSSCPRILFIEDNAIAMKIGQTLLQNEGCQVQVAETAEVAMKLFKSETFDLVISDLGLPGMQGDEMTVTLRHWEKASAKMPVPIVALTAHADNRIKENCLLAGMNQVYFKPLDSGLLKKILAEWVEVGKSEALTVNKEDKDKGKPTKSGLGVDLPATEDELFQLEHYALLDEREGIERMSDKRGFREGLVLTLEEILPAEITNLEEAYLIGDWDKLQKIAHKLKGGSGYLGTIRMTYACQYLERYWKAGHRSRLEDLYRQLMTVLEQTKNAIQLWLSQNE